MSTSVLHSIKTKVTLLKWSILEKKEKCTCSLSNVNIDLDPYLQGTNRLWKYLHKKKKAACLDWVLKALRWGLAAILIVIGTLRMDVPHKMALVGVEKFEQKYTTDFKTG